MIDFARLRETKYRAKVNGIVVVSTAMGMLGFIYTGIGAGLYAMGILGAMAAYLLGFLGAQQNRVEAHLGTREFAKPWLWLTAFSALALIQGTWQPLMFFGGVGAGLVLLYRSGAWIGHKLPLE
jgi:hypothetical protein